MNELPIIAIVGRPNVGKSTLFNRYTGFRRSLVADEPGITRDRVVAEIQVADKKVLLVDTAGLDFDFSSDIDSDVQKQAREAVLSASAVLFVLDGRDGVSPEDEAVAQELRKSAKPVSLLVNKLDVPAHDVKSADFYELGFEHVWPVSGAHGRGVWAPLEALAKNLPEPKPSEKESAIVPRVALVGRPNVGKSSLLNRILGSDRVVVSNEPGTTRDAIDVEVQNEGRSYLFVDTAGIRKPGRRSRLAERGSAIMSLRALERAEIALVILDAETGITEQDARVLGLAQERGCAVGVLLNKWDLMKQSSEIEKGRLFDELARRLRAFSSHETIRISALTGKGCNRIYSVIDRLAKASRKHVATPELNRWLEDVVKRHEPAMAQRGPRKKPVKFFYATQTGVNPPRISVFCSEPRAIKASYIRFLENRYREAFSESGVPIKITLRSRRHD